MNNEERRIAREQKELRRRRGAIKKNRILVSRVFFAVFLLIALIGLLLPLRPKTSAIEKRDLEKFPHFSFAGIWDGSYFSQISTWYADTFPFREKLISADSSVKGL